jgi:hypothetical protein
MQFCFAFSYSQDYSTKLYDERLGLNQKVISEILRDKYGFIWLGTESGIVRFDGSNFNLFTPKEIKYNKLGFKKIKIINNHIFINYEKNGVLLFDLQTYRFEIILNEPVIDIQPISDNTFLVLTKSGFLKKIIDGKIVLQLKIPASEGSLMTLFRDDLYISLPRIGIQSYNVSNLKLLKIYNHIIPDGYLESFDANSRYLAFVSNARVKIVEGDLIVSKTLKNALIDANPKDIVTYYKFVTPQIQLFILQNKTIYQMSPTRRAKLYFKDHVNYELLSLFAVDTNNFFVGTGQGLIEVNKNDNSHSVIDDNIPLFGNALRIRRSILEKKDGSLILMGYPINVDYSNKQFRKIGDSICSTNQSVLLGDYIYVCFDNLGFVKINSKTGKSETLDRTSIRQSYFGIFHDTLNRIIIAGGDGYLAIHDLKSLETKVLKVFKDRVSIMSIIYDPIMCKYWLGTNVGLYVCDKKFNIIKSFATRLNNCKGDFYSALLIPKSRNEIWAAHNEGVSVFNLLNQKLIYDLPNNIFLNRKTVSLIEDNYHRIWMGTYQGIIGIDPEKKYYIRLTKKNKLINSEFNYTSAAKLTNGDLIFGGLNAYDIINPAKFKFDKKSIKPVISGYEIYSNIDTVFYAYTGNDLNINIDKQYIKLYLSTTNSLSKNTSIEYNLDNGPWLSTNNFNQIILFNLLPGSHLLHIRLFDEFGVATEMKPLQIIAYVSFYKSNLFIWLLIVLVFIGFALYLYSNFRKRKIQQITKENISMDLHDEVGTILTRVLYLLKLESNDNKVISYLSDALFSLRVYINTMNKSYFNIQQLLDDLNELSVNILGEDIVYFKYKGTKKLDIEINSDLYRDIKLCIYEVLNNIQKHANASEVHLNFEIVDNNIQVRIIDNGCYNVSLQKPSVGNGLYNIKKRVARNEGIVTFEQNTQSTGLQVSLSIPIKKITWKPNTK